jgi:hypothetical protein
MLKMTNHQTIAITVSGLAELAHSEYQVCRFCWPSSSPFSSGGQVTFVKHR